MLLADRQGHVGWAYGGKTTASLKHFLQVFVCFLVCLFEIRDSKKNPKETRQNPRVTLFSVDNL
jgi:hypothetical protein